MARTTYYSKPTRLEKLTKQEQLELTLDLLNAFKILKNLSETAEFLKDLLTAKEIKNLAKRLRIAKLLLAGKTHEKIVKTLHTSFATVTKISLWLSQGGSGFKKVISKLPSKYETPGRLPPGPIEFHLPQTVAAVLQYSLTKSQNKKLERFTEKVEGKRILDKSLQEGSDKEFQSRRHKRKLPKDKS